MQPDPVAHHDWKEKDRCRVVEGVHKNVEGSVLLVHEEPGKETWLAVCTTHGDIITAEAGTVIPI
jgi:hypothetical protein